MDFALAAVAFAPGLALGHAIGRVGCFAAGCCWGKPTTSWIGVHFSAKASELTGVPIDTALIPTQLIEAAANLAQRVRRFTDLPVAVGFGVSTSEQVRAFATLPPDHNPLYTNFADKIRRRRVSMRKSSRGYVAGAALAALALLAAAGINAPAIPNDEHHWAGHMRALCR